MLYNVTIGEFSYLGVSIVLLVFVKHPNMKKQLADLVLKALNGNRESLELLCHKAGQFMRSYFLRKFQDENVVDDLCQETYFRLLKSFKNIQEPTKFKNFVLKTSFHVLQDFLRDKIKNTNTFSNNENKYETLDSRTLSSSKQIIESVDIKSALSKLPEKSQLILKLNSEGFKYHEIATMVNLSESAVKMQVKRSLKKIKSIMM